MEAEVAGQAEEGHNVNTGKSGPGWLLSKQPTERFRTKAFRTEGKHRGDHN